MNVSFFIARRLYADPEGQLRSSRPAIRVALMGIVIGVLVMVLTLCVVVGFKRTITDKVACFGAHIQITNFDSNNTFELQPVAVSDSLLQHLSSLRHVKRVETFLTKPCILKTDDSFQGIVLKGKDALDFLLPNLLSGRLPETDTEVLCSDCLCRDLKLALGDRIDCYSVGEQVQVRRFTISGIYATGFQEADKMYVWSRSSVVRRLNHWSDNQVSGIEITVDNIAHLEEVSDLVWFATANRFDEDGNGLYAQTLQQLNPQIFAWLDLLDMNVIVIIILMLCVSGFNIISGLIILILDSIRLIGTLKALGADNLFVRRIFVYEAAMLIGKGVLIGNVLALALAVVQYTTHLLPLDPVTYYVDFVPVAFPWLWLLLLNIGVVLVSVLVLLVPSVVAAHISPARVMRFE